MSGLWVLRKLKLLYEILALASLVMAIEATIRVSVTRMILYSELHIDAIDRVCGVTGNYQYLPR